MDIFKNDTNTSYYNDILSPNNHDYYKFEKGVEGKIKYLTADAYMEMCKRYVFSSDPYSAVSNKKVDQYAENIKRGDRFPLPYINVTEDNPGQEGRHRMLAAAKVYGEDAEFPVLVVTDSAPSDDEIRDYASRKYPSDPEWGYNYIHNIIYPEVQKIEEPYSYDVLEAEYLSKGDIVDLNGGMCRVTSIIDSSEIHIQAEPLFDESDNWYYICDRSDLVKYYPPGDNPELYDL